MINDVLAGLCYAGAMDGRTMEYHIETAAQRARDRGQEVRVRYGNTGAEVSVHLIPDLEWVEQPRVWIPYSISEILGNEDDVELFMWIGLLNHWQESPLQENGQDHQIAS